MDLIQGLRQRNKETQQKERARRVFETAKRCIGDGAGGGTLHGSRRKSERRRFLTEVGTGKNDVGECLMSVRVRSMQE